MRSTRAYLQSATRTADPRELVVMLYDGILRFVTEAELRLDAQERAQATQAVGRAMDIVHELMCSLDHGPMPQLSHQLESLYIYISERLLHISLRQDREAIAEVRSLVSELREGWAEALRQLRQAELEAAYSGRLSHAAI